MDMKRILHAAGSRLRGPLALVAAFTLLLTSLSGVAAALFSAGAEDVTVVVQDYENVFAVGGVAAQQNMGTCEIVEVEGDKKLHFANTSKIGWPNAYLYVTPGKLAGDAVRMYVEADKTPMIDNLYFVFADGSQVTASSYFVQPTGWWEISLASLTDEQKASLRGFRWHYDTYANSGDFNIYIDDVTVVNPVNPNVLPDRDTLLYDFSTEDQAAKIQPSQGTITYADGAVTFMPTVNAYGGFYITGDPGDLAGDGISFKYTANKNIQFYRLQFVYLNENGAEKDIVYEWSNGAHVDCGTSGTRTITYTADVKAVADRLVKVLVYAHNMTANSTTYTIDNVVVLNTQPRVSLTATAAETETSITAAWQSKETLTSMAVYSSYEPINATAFESGDVTGLTLVSEELAGSKVYSGLQPKQTCYFALKAMIGSAAVYRYAQASTADVKLLTNFEDVQLVEVSAGQGSVEDGVLKHNLAAAEYTRAFSLDCTRGELYGSGLYITYTATLKGASAHAYQAVFHYLDAEGNAATYTKNDWEGGVVNFDLLEGTHTRYIPFPNGVDVSTITHFDFWIRTTSREGGPTVAFDDVYLKDPKECVKIQAKPTEGGVMATWSAMSDSSVKVYMADHAISEKQLATPDAYGLTLISEAASGTYVAEGLNRTVYFAAFETEAGGKTRFVTSDGVKLIQDFENVEKLSDYAYDHAGKFPVSVTERGGSKMATWTGSDGLVNMYPHLTLSAPAGSFVGDAVRFYIDSTDLSGERRNEWFDTLSIFYYDLAGEPQVLTMRQYSSIVTDTYFELPLTSLTDEQLAGMYAIDWYGANGDKLVYVDNVYVVNPGEIKDISVALTVKPDAEDPQTAVITPTLGEDITSHKIYQSESAITAAMIEAFEKGTQNGLSVVSGTTVAGCEYGKTYYFALRALDSKGYPLYAFAAFAAKEPALLIEDYENVTDVGDVAAGNNNLGEVSLVDHGGSKMVEFYHSTGVGYPHVQILAKPGDLSGDAVRFYYEMVQVDDNATGFIDGLSALYKDATGVNKSVQLMTYFAPTSGAIFEISLASLTDEQKAGLYGFDWYYNGNTGKKKIYVDDLSVLNYRDGLHSFGQSQNELTGDVTLKWEFGNRLNQNADFTVHAFTASSQIDAATVEAHLAGTDTTKLTQIASGAGLLTATATDLPRYTTNYFAVRAENGQGDVFYQFSQITEENYTVVQDYENVSKLNQVAHGNAMAANLVTEGDDQYLTFAWTSKEWKWCSMYLKFQPGDLTGDAIRFYYENDHTVGINDINFFYTDTNGVAQTAKGRQYFTPTSGQYLVVDFPASMTPAERASITQIQFVFNAVDSTPLFTCKVDDVGVLNYYDSVSSLTATFNENENDGTAHLSWNFAQRKTDASAFDVRVFASREAITEERLQAYIADPDNAAITPFKTGTGLTAATYLADGDARYATHSYAVVAFDEAGNGSYALFTTAEVAFRPLYIFESGDQISDYQAYTSSLGGQAGIYVNADSAYGVVNSIVSEDEVEEANKPFVTGNAMKMHFTKNWAEHVVEAGYRWPGLTYYAPNYGDFAGDGISITFSKTPTDAGNDVPFHCQLTLITEDGTSYSTDTWSSQIIDAATTGQVFNIPYTSFRRYENGEPQESLTAEMSQYIVRTWFVIQAPLSWGEFAVYIDSFKVLNPYKVERPLEQVVFAEEKVILRPDSYYAPQYAKVPQNTTMGKLVWTSSNTDVATVDQLGNVTTVGKGSAYITATGENGVSGQFKVVSKESVSGMFRVLEDFDDGNIPDAFKLAGYTGVEMEYVKVHERNAVRFTGNGGKVTYTAKDYAFYGDGLGVWLYGERGGNATVTFRTSDGKTFSTDYPVDGDEGDFAVLLYSTLKKDGTGKAPTEQDIINFKSVTFAYTGGELYLDSLQVSAPRTYNRYQKPQNEDNGTGIKVQQSVLDKSGAVYHANTVTEGLDYDWAVELLDTNGYYTGEEDVKFYSIYYLDDYYREKKLSGEAKIDIPFPEEFYGQDNIWVIRLGADGSLTGLRAEHDRETITVKSAEGGVFALWMRYDTEGLYYQLKDRVVIELEDEDEDHTIITDPEIDVPGDEDTEQPGDEDQLGDDQLPDGDEEDGLPEENLPEGALAQGTCGTDLNWTLFEDGELVIGGTGAMDDFNDYSPWADYLDQIKYVTVLDGVTSVGACAFYGCTQLEDVLLPASLTTIGDYAFFQCDKLKHLTVPAAVTTIGDYAIGYTINDKSEFAIVPGFVLYGTENTAAATYAATYRLPFNGADQAPAYRGDQGMPGWAWIVIGVGGGITLLEVLFILIIILKKRKQQNGKEEADNA